MSGSQAAEILGISRQRFADMVKAGQIRQHNFFGREYVSSDDVTKLSKTERKPGRPAKRKTTPASAK
jgi:excisionase family DNA binding protein